LNGRLLSFFMALIALDTLSKPKFFAPKDTIFQSDSEHDDSASIIR
jgi:hypothetical protein